MPSRLWQKLCLLNLWASCCVFATGDSKKEPPLISAGEMPVLD